MPGRIRYEYRPRLNLWGVYKITTKNDGTQDIDRIEIYGTKNEARERVYELNGWKLNKKRNDCKLV